MGETLKPIDPVTAEPNLEKLENAHSDTLRFFMLPPCKVRDKLFQDCLRGSCLNISDTNNAGVEALKNLGTERVTGIYFPTTPHAPYREMMKEWGENKAGLISRLKLIPDRSIRLVTIFDYGKDGGGLVATQALREIERILMAKGQYLISCMDMRQIPRHDERSPEPDEEAGDLGRKLSSLAFLSRLPHLPYYWREMDSRYYPNKYVSIYTKRHC